MFNSTGNNFGAGVIQFKDVQESNYIVLNAKFTCSPQNAAYQAADVLEIYVPELSIARSTEAGVVVRIRIREDMYGRTYNYDCGTVAKSWVKDANTLCIEKLPIFDEQTELIIYIQTLYCQLGQGGNSSKGKKKSITCVSEDSFLRFGSSDTLCVVFEKWAFVHLMYDSCTYAMRDKDWEAFFENLPTDITVDLPVMAAANYKISSLGSINECHIEEGYFTFPYAERGLGLDNTANYVFCFAYLIRDVEPEQPVEGRLRVQAEQLKVGQYDIFYDFDLELIPNPAQAACSGRAGIYSKGEVTFPVADFPDEIPEFEAYFLDAHQHGNGLTVQLLKMEVTKNAGSGSVKITDCVADNNLSFKMFDTAIPMAIE